MKALYKPLFAAVALTAAVFSGQALALPSCATSIGMTVTVPGGSALSPEAGSCREIAGGFNAPVGSYGSTNGGIVLPTLDAFLAQVVGNWGGHADDWLLLGEVDLRREGSPTDPAFGYQFSEPRYPIGSDNSPSGGFSMRVEMSDAGAPFEGKTLEIIGVMKPNLAADPGRPEEPASYPDVVLGYHFADVAFKSAGTLTGTFDFRPNPTDDGLYIVAGIALFGRLIPATEPGRVPEPTGIALLGCAVLAAAIARRGRRIS